ncbi:MAG TPA: DUF2255 family protein [Trebonia sp.]|nr:DUF2255 family protein [Trebonia sp.]
MATWTQDELGKVAGADELRISSVRRDGSLNNPRTIWVVRHGDDLYVRSVNGPSAAWYRGTQATHQGHIEAGGVSRDVTFADPGPGTDDQLDDDYRAKYSRYPANIVSSILTSQARSTTIRLLPR